MTGRCLVVTHPQYKDYGGRGIKICKRWLERNGQGTRNFIADMGEKPSSKHSLDRIDNDGDYTPENCRWATPSEQQLNRRAFKHKKHLYT
jgi:hypothetical protein